MSEITPTFSKVLQDAIEARVVDFRVAMPGVVVTYNVATQRASIQPSLKSELEDGSTQTLPIISNVPVLFPRTANAWITLPVKPGDRVVLLFADRSLDKWSKSPELTVDPGETRKHDLSDAIAIPGGYPLPGVMVPSPSPLAIELNNTLFKMRLLPTGKLSAENATGELISILSRLVQAIINARVATLLGPQPLLSLLDPFPLIGAELDTFKV